MTNEALQNLLTRRSCRKYLPAQITAEELDTVLQAGIYAPTAMGKQSPRIVAVQDPEIIDRMRKWNAAVMGTDNDPFYGAPTVCVVLAPADAHCPVEDGSLVLGNMMNAAAAIGLGSCWINRAREVFETEEGKALLAQWGFEGQWIGIGNCILGYADGPCRPARPRKDDYILKV